jgi:amidophosphoribosyltransferase
VFGIFGHSEAAALAALGLHALQHRGQEAAGIVAYDGEQFHAHRGMGHVGENFSSKDVIERLSGHSAIGHVRYATTGEVAMRNVQPLFADFEFGGLAICHNGNLTNSYKLRQQLVRRGSLFQSTSDTEVIVHLIATSLKLSVEERMIDALRQVQGAYSLAALSAEGLIAVRDPLGVRPLVLGKLGDGWIVASESCALDIIGARFVCEIEPGSVVRIEGSQVEYLTPLAPKPLKRCVFELVYFSRPDSVIFGESVGEFRRNLGRQLAREHPAPGADCVFSVPDSSNAAALGFSEESGIRLENALIRNHYVGRTFIQPQQSIRHFGVRVKLNPVRSILEGKRVVLVDDSIVRGTTSRKIVRMVKAAGAKEVHMRISCPPTISPCFYGVDTPRRSELIAATHTLDEIRRYLDAESLNYLSLDGLLEGVGEGRQSYCTSCYTGQYPVEFPRNEQAYLQLTLKPVERERDPVTS